MIESWRDIAGYEGIYQVSDLGRIKALAKTMSHNNCHYPESIKKLKNHKSGYTYVILRKDGGYETLKVHRVVLSTFVGPCPQGFETRHLNGDRKDNRLENLVWGTSSENNNDTRRHGRAKLRPVIRSDGLVFECIADAAKFMGVSWAAIYKSCKGGMKVRGYGWCYA